MEAEKNKETVQNELNIKQSINENENSNYNNNNSEAFRHMNHQKIKINEEKINEEKLKDAKEQTMQIKTDLTINDSQNPVDITQKNIMHSTFNYTDSQNYYHLINRCLTAKIKTLIIIIFLVLSLFFLFLSIFDIINSLKKSNFFKQHKFIMNNIFIFIFQIVYALAILIFQGLTIVLEPKENIVFNIITIFFISLIIILRTILVIKNNDKKSTMLFNFICSIFLTFINLGILLITLKILKMKKNVKQNIEEIINFTDIIQATNSKIGDKKDNQLALNNSDSENKGDNLNNSKGISSLVEETNNNDKNNIQNNSQK